MKTLVFSDTHLGQGKFFEEKKYRFLERIIKDSDHVIINGDFWDGFFITFEQFRDSPYKHLFPLLKSKKTVYIPGNHDDTGMSEPLTSLFAENKTLRHEFTHQHLNFVLEHGDQQIEIFKTEKAILKKNRVHIARGLNKIEYFITRNFKDVKMLKAGQKRYNTVIKKSIKKFLKEDQIFICGHTHLAEFNLKERFINTGMIKHGLAQYLIIENGTLTPKEEWYA